MKFSAQFYDRTFQRQASVEVTFGEQCLIIHFPSENRTDTWQISEITSADAHHGEVILQRGKQFLEVRDTQFLPAFKARFSQSKLFRRRGFFDTIGLAGCLIFVLFFILPIVVFYIWGVPALADRAAQEISPRLEKEMGDAIYQSFTVDFEIDTARSKLIQQFFEALDFGKEYDFRLTVVQENQINAFAVPGGRIVVFSGILDIIETPEALAALLGHEASHVLLKHSLRSIFRAAGSSIAISLLFGDYGEAVGIVSKQANELRGLAYSREFETEADENGLQLMLASGVHPRGIVELFEKMQVELGESQDENVIKHFMSTHPATSERLQNMRETIARLPAAPDAISPAARELFYQLKR